MSLLCLVVTASSKAFSFEASLDSVSMDGAWAFAMKEKKTEILRG